MSQTSGQAWKAGAGPFLWLAGLLSLTRLLRLGEWGLWIDEAYTWAFEILTERKEEWERLAQGLLEYETLTGEEIKRVIKGEPPQASQDEDDSSDAGSAPSVTAIPKTKPRPKPGGGMEPEPTA